MRTELNGSKKEIIRLEQEMKGLRRKEEMVSKRLNNLQGTVIRQFCNNVCKVLEVPPVIADNDSKS